MFEMKYDGRHKVRCITGSNRVETADIDASATTAQNSTVYLMLLASIQ